MDAAATVEATPTYAIYLYPRARDNEDFALAARRLTTRLRECGYSEFKIPEGGMLPGAIWAMECHFAGTREEIFPGLPEDLVNPDGD